MEKIYGFVRMDIRPGQIDAFIEGAKACHAAAIPDLTGTQLYEWILSADGRQAWVIEVYDDAEAIAHHGRMLDGRSTRLREFADISICFAGNLPDGLMDRMRERLGAVEYFGPRQAGLLTEPTGHSDPGDSSERIMALAWFEPHEGQADRLRELALQNFDRARASDPGTMAYEWFFADDGKAMALDVYENADAMTGHMRNCGPIMGEILKISQSRTNLYGALPDSIAGSMRPELGITHFPRRLHGVF